MPAFSADDVLVSEARVLYAPLGTDLPDETADDYDDYADWPTGWTLMGYTTTPATIGYSYDVFNVEVQQSTSPIRSSKTTETLTIGTTLAQFDADLLALVLAGTATPTAAGVGQKGFSQVLGGGDTQLQEYMFALEGYRPDTNGDKQPVRFILFRANITASGDIPFDKAGVTGIPITITGLADPARTVGEQLYQIDIVTAPATTA